MPSRGAGGGGLDQTETTGLPGLGGKGRRRDVRGTAGCERMREENARDFPGRSAEAECWTVRADTSLVKARSRTRRGCSSLKTEKDVGCRCRSHAPQGHQLSRASQGVPGERVDSAKEVAGTLTRASDGERAKRGAYVGYRALRKGTYRTELRVKARRSERRRQAFWGDLP